jgi:hypothetical protein
MGASGRTDLAQSTESRRLCRHWRPPPLKRRSPALGGTSNRAEADINSTTIRTPNRLTRPTIFVRTLYLGGEADGYRLLGRHAPAQHNVHRVAEVAP